MDSRVPYLCEARSVRLLERLRHSETEDPAFERYLSACESYYRRQLLIHEHAPERPFGGPEGDEGARFVDRNT